jgi:phosphoketolase
MLCSSSGALDYSVRSLVSQARGSSSNLLRATNPFDGVIMADKLSFEIAEEAKIIATELIQKHHLHLVDEDVPLVCVFRSKGGTGKAFYARARQVKGGLVGFLAQQFIKSNEKYRDSEEEIETFHIIEIVKPLWEHLTYEQKTALIDHELMHFGPEGKMRRHDLEEFRDVVERHGFYLPDVKDFAESIKKVEEAKTTATEEAPEAPVVFIEDTLATVAN